MIHPMNHIPSIPHSTVKVPGLRASFPIYDMRDGKPHESWQFKTPTQFIPGLAWNAYCERSIQGSSCDHDKDLARLVREARRDGKTVLFASLHNYAASIYTLNA
jgi:hypothetical protein